MDLYHIQLNVCQWGKNKGLCVNLYSKHSCFISMLDKSGYWYDTFFPFNFVVVAHFA